MTLEADENDQDESVDQDEQDLDAMFDAIVDGQDTDDISSEADKEDLSDDDEPGAADEAGDEVDDKTETETKTEEDDPWKDAPEALRNAFNETQEALKQAKHQAHSNAGRVGAFQRQINDLNQKLSQQTSQKPASSDKKPPSGAAQEETPSDELTSEFEEEYPQVAAYVRNREAAQQEEIGQLKTQVNTLLSSENQRDEQSQYAALEAAHPEWETTAVSDEFRDWISKQPANVQALTKSSIASEAIWLFDTYKGATKPAEKEADGDAVDISGERDKRRKAAATIPAKRGRQASLDSGGDEEALFNRIASSRKR